EARELVAGPLADGGAGDVADVVHVEAEERPQLGPGELRGQPREPLPPEAIEAHALFPVHPHRAVGGQSHQAPPDLRLGGRPLRRNASTARSRAIPAFSARATASAKATIWTASPRFVAIFIVTASPRGPT